MYHSLHPHDLGSCDFWLFPKLKNATMEQGFADIPDIQRNVTTLLQSIPENNFLNSFLQWHHHLTKYIASQGEHFEGDSSCNCRGK
jgi:hypothetical protein